MIRAFFNAHRALHRKRHRFNRVFAPLITVLLIASLAVGDQVLTSTTSPAGASPATPVTNTWTADPNADVSTTGTWTKTSCGATNASCISDYPDATGTSYIAGPNVTNNQVLILDTVNPPANLGAVESIQINAYAKDNSAGVVGGADTITLAPDVMTSGNNSMTGGALGGTAQTLTTSWANYTWNLSPKAFDYSASTWNNMRFEWTQGYAGVTGADSTAQALIASTTLSVTYRIATGTTTQQGYIFENDDGNGNADSNSAQAAGNTAITGVTQGERLDVRTQVASATNAESANASLFYDRNDGYWTKVKSGTTPITSTGTCTDTNFNCTAIDTALDVEGKTSVAVDSTGKTWVSYYDNGNDHLRVAEYVGSGGTGCATAAWNCTTITNGTGAGEGSFNSIAIDANNVVWVSYYDSQNTQLMVASNVAGTGCAISSWTCTAVKTGVTLTATNIAIGPNGVPWVGYSDNTPNFYIAQYGAASGSGCTSVLWAGCTRIDTGSGTYASMGFTSTGVPWVAWQAGDNSMEVAHWVGTGGTNCNIGATWQCTSVTTIAHNSQYQSLAIAPDGTPWVSYYDGSTHSLNTAVYLNGATTGTGCASNLWTCTTVDSSSTDTGRYTSIAFDASGAAWIVYNDNLNDTLRLARYAGGTSGNCTSTAWKCTTIQSSNVGSNTGLAFAPDGTAEISYNYDSGHDLRVATLNRGGELMPATSSTTGSSAVTKSHSDMISATDTANQADADCISGTWINGKTSSGEEVTGESIPAGDCTEFQFSLDTSHAQASTTYRLVTSFSDPQPGAKSYWRGPTSVTQYPTLTTASTSNFHYSKDAEVDDANCYNTAWACSAIDATAATVGVANSLAFDPNGTPWMVYDDDTNHSTRYATYVGGTSGNCTNTAWNCGVLDSLTTPYATSGTNGTAGSGEARLAIAPDGTVWAAWTGTVTNVTGIVSLRVGKYVGTGGTGCGTGTAWTCTTIDTNAAAGVANATGLQPSLALDSTGTPWISYFDNLHLSIRLTHFVGTGGTGCTSTAWTCINVAVSGTAHWAGSTGQAASSTSLIFDNTGAPQIAYQYYTSGSASTMNYARYVGVGGTGCTNSAWSCTVIDSSAACMGRFAALAADSNGNIWLAYQNCTSTYQMVAKFLKGATTGSCTNTGWACTTVDTNAGRYSTIALDQNGNPWIAVRDDGAGYRKVDYYVGSGGNCPGDGTTAAPAWQCTQVAGGASSWGSIAFDNSGTPWIASYNSTNARLDINKLRLPAGAPTGAPSPAATGYTTNGQISTQLRYPLDSGLSPRSSTCAANANLQGACGVAISDTSYDQMAAKKNETPIYSMAMSSATNTSFPGTRWVGQSSVALGTDNVTVQVYRFGTTNAWTTLNTISSGSANVDVSSNSTASAGSASEYYNSVNGTYYSYFRVYQASSSTGETLKTNYFGAPDAAPNAPSGTVQKNSASVLVATGGYSSGTSANFVGTVSDPDAGDTVKLCVEVQPINTAFTNTPTVCSALISNGGLANAIATGLTDGTSYHWQVEVVDNSGQASAWVSYGGNSDGSPPTTPADVDFIVDATAPAVPTSLAQYAADGVTTIPIGGYTNGAVVFKGSVTPDSGAPIALCVEKVKTNLSLGTTADLCSSYGASGTTSVTLTPGSDGNFHWEAATKDQAGNFSAWVSFGGNSDVVTAATDFGLDTVVPTTGSVYDGGSAGVDAQYNNGSLSSLSCNWTGFADAASGINSYQYSFGTTPGATDVVGWQTATSTTLISFPATLHTSQVYYCNVKAIDNAGNSSSVVSSDGQQVAPTLTFSASTNVVNFAALNGGNSYTDTQSLTLTTSTNAYNGYTIAAYETQPLTSSASTIADYASPASAPTTWSGTGFGYNVSGGASASAFSGSKYAHFGTGASPDTPVAHAGLVTGTPIASESETVNLKLASSAAQAAGAYTTSLVWTATAAY